MFWVQKNTCKSLRLTKSTLEYSLVPTNEEDRVPPNMFKSGQPVMCKKLAEGETTDWAHYSFVVHDSWQSFTVFCEARDGLMLLRQRDKPSDENIALETEQRISVLRAEAQMLEGHSQHEEAAALYKQLRQLQEGRPKVVCSVMTLTTPPAHLTHRTHLSTDIDRTV
jgi:hypothetical protein